MTNISLEIFITIRPKKQTVDELCESCKFSCVCQRFSAIDYWQECENSISSFIFKLFQDSLSVLTGKVGTVTMVTGLRTAACPTNCGWGASTAVGFPSDGLPWLITAALFTWAPLVLAWGLAWTCGRVWWVKVWVMWPTMVGWETDTPCG